jgi:hypothetical protein
LIVIEAVDYGDALVRSPLRFLLLLLLLQNLNTLAVVVLGSPEPPISV